VKKHGTIKKKPIPYALLKQLQDQSKSILVANFHGVNWWEQSRFFPNFVIYHDPIDFPGRFAIRFFDGDKPSRLVCVKRTLEEARATIPDVFVKFERKETDDPKIVEAWM